MVADQEFEAHLLVAIFVGVYKKTDLKNNQTK